MKLNRTATLAAFTLSTTVFASAAFAAGKSGGSNGASTYSPGHQMQSATTSTAPGASEYAPGQLMRDSKATTPPTPSTAPGASGYTPGDMISKGKK